MASRLGCFRRIKRRVLGPPPSSRSRRTAIGRRRLCLERLEERQLLSISLAPIADQTAPAGPALHVALQGLSSDHNPVDYLVSITQEDLANSTVASPHVTALVPSGNPSIDIRVDDYGDNIHGDMIFQLFKDLAPNTVGQSRNWRPRAHLSTMV